MSESQSPSREVSRRVFASEFADATYTFKEGDDERSPIYALLPTGKKANRVFIVGTATEVTDVGSDSEYWQARLVDPAGDTFFVYAGQYQPEAAALFQQLETPEYLAVTGKPRTYETDEGVVNVSLRPETVSVVDQDTRNKWTVDTAERTLDRLNNFEATTEYTELAREKYENPNLQKYKDAATTALEDVAAGQPSSDSSEAAEQAPN